MTQSWTPNLNGVAAMSASGSYSQTTDTDGTSIYTAWFTMTYLRSALASLATSTPAAALYIGGLPVSAGADVSIGTVGPVNGMVYPAGCSQLYLTAANGSVIGIDASGSGIQNAALLTSDIMAQGGAPGRGNPGNFLQIAGSITFHG